MKQDDEVIKTIFVTAYIPHIINQVKRIGAPGICGRNGEFMLGDGKDAHADAPDISDENLPRRLQVFARARRGYSCFGTDLDCVFESGCAVVQDVVVCQGKHVNAGLLECR